MIELKNTAHLADTEIVQFIKEGQTPYYELLIRRNNPYLYKIGRTYGFTHEQVEDLMQETFVQAYLNLKKFENRSTFKTWIIKIMLNQCYHAKQKTAYKNIQLSGIEFNDNLMPIFSNHMHNDANRTVLSRELNHIIENAIANIPEDYRVVFSLREMTGLSTAETAEALNITESNVKVRHSRAKSMLRKEVEKMYTAEDIFEFNLVYCDGIVNRVMNLIE